MVYDLCVKTLSVVSPVFNEVEGIELFCQEIFKYLDDLDYQIEILLCVDPCTDGTEMLITNLHKSDARVKMIRFNRRVGQDIAVLAGIEHAIGDAIIIMDCDLQDPPSVLPEMVGRWSNGAKMILGKRASRESDRFSKKLSSDLFYRFLNRFSEFPFPRDTGDFRLIDKSLASYVNQFHESNPFTKGIMAEIGADYEVVEFARPERLKGTTKYNELFGGYKIAFKTIVSYSNVLLKLSLVAGFGISFLSIIFGIGYAVSSFFDPNLPVGLPTIVVLVSFLSGSILMSVGILGLYIDRIFDEVKQRPRFTIKEFLNG
jgi:glycosyltransferase involved in cell wall biosynthesis